MATWVPLRKKLNDVQDSITFSWVELDRMVGGLPPSATAHREFWSGVRPLWPGFRTRDVRIGERVTFVRMSDRVVSSLAGGGPGDVERSAADADLVLRAAAATGIDDPERLAREGLETLIRLASARKLASVGGSDPHASAAPRGRGV